MKTVIIEYATISPAILSNKIEKVLQCLTSWKDIDENYFEFSVSNCINLDKLESILAEYV